MHAFRGEFYSCSERSLYPFHSKKDPEREERTSLVQVSMMEILEAQREEVELKEQQEQLKQRILLERGFDPTEPEW